MKRRIALFGILLVCVLLCALWFEQKASVRPQEESCEWPCICICPTATVAPAPTITPIPTITSVPGFGTVTVAHITDLHAGGASNNSEGIEWMITQINAWADIVVNTGDCTEHSFAPEWALYSTWMNAFTIPWLDVAGNHDSGFPRARNWVTQTLGYTFVGLDWITPDISLVTNATPPVVVFSHRPLTDSPPEVRSAVANKHPLAWICGHIHYWSTGYVDGVLQLTIARSGLGTYRIITLTNGALIY